MSQPRNLIGIDIVLRSRIASDLDAWGQNFSNRVLHPRERSAWSSDPLLVAAAVALKEATYKACGPFNARLGWHDILIETTKQAGAHWIDLGARLIKAVVPFAELCCVLSYVPGAGVSARAAWGANHREVVAVAVSE